MLIGRTIHGRQRTIRWSAGLPLRSQPLQGQVRIKISGQQNRLIEHEARVPDRRRAAQQRQRHLGKHRLDDEEQGSANEERESEAPCPARQSRGDRSRRCPPARTVILSIGLGPPSLLSHVDLLKSTFPIIPAGEMRCKVPHTGTFF